jgi:hypothetical protein
MPMAKRRSMRTLLLCIAVASAFACGGESYGEAPPPIEILARDVDPARALFRDGNDVVVARDERIQRIVRDGSVSAIDVPGYRACPEGPSEWTKEASEPSGNDVAIAGDEIVLALRLCTTSRLWTRQIGSGRARVLVAKDTTGYEHPSDIAITARGRGVFACIGPGGGLAPVELRAFDLATGQRETIATLSDRLEIRKCEAVFADESALYVVASPRNTTVLRVDIRTHDVKSVFDDAPLTNVGQDDGAIYGAMADGTIARIDKVTFERSTFPAPAPNVRSIGGEGASVYVAGRFVDARAGEKDAVWTAERESETTSRRLALLDSSWKLPRASMTTGLVVTDDSLYFLVSRDDLAPFGDAIARVRR